MKTIDFTIEQATFENAAGILGLYREVAEIEGGLARTADEMSKEYVEYFLQHSLADGLCVIARNSEGKIVGEIHAYGLGPRVFSHVLGELTIAVDPAFQGSGVGRALFARFMELVEKERPDILRVELIARESNRRAIGFYESIGFQIEGRLRRRIASVGGGFEDDVPMAWLRSE